MMQFRYRHVQPYPLTSLHGDDRFFLPSSLLAAHVLTSCCVLVGCWCRCAHVSRNDVSQCHDNYGSSPGYDVLLVKTRVEEIHWNYPTGSRLDLAVSCSKLNFGLRDLFSSASFSLSSGFFASSSTFTCLLSSLPRYILRSICNQSLPDHLH